MYVTCFICCDEMESLTVSWSSIFVAGLDQLTASMCYKRDLAFSHYFIYLLIAAYCCLTRSVIYYRFTSWQLRVLFYVVWSMEHLIGVTGVVGEN